MRPTQVGELCPKADQPSADRPKVSYTSTAWKCWQYPLRGVVAPSSNGSQNVGDLQQGRDQTLCPRRQLSLANLFLKDEDALGELSGAHQVN